MAATCASTLGLSIRSLKYCSSIAAVILAFAILQPRTFSAEKEDNRPIVVFCHAEWCGPCKRMQAEMKKVRNMDLVVYGELDVDQEPERAARIMQGNSVPQLIVYVKVDGKMTKKAHIGFRNARQIEAIFHDAHVQSVRQVD